MFLLILSGFQDHKNLKSMLFSSFINVSLGLGKVNSKWFNPDIIKVFITVTFPSGVRYLLFHLLIIPFISSIFSEKFKSIQLSNSVEKLIPRSLNLLSPAGL